MADSQRKRPGTAAGPGIPAAPTPPMLPRRRLTPPANDNALAPAQRILRAVLFVAIGAGLAWLLRMALG